MDRIAVGEKRPRTDSGPALSSREDSHDNLANAGTAMDTETVGAVPAATSADGQPLIEQALCRMLTGLVQKRIIRERVYEIKTGSPRY